MGNEAINGRYSMMIEDDLRSAIPEPGTGSGAEATALATFYTMLRYHMGWMSTDGAPVQLGGGKRLRPTFCLLACEAVGGAAQQALPAGTAIELLHNFTLIHDDIQDRSEERRHRPTVWKLWGEEQAINAGDALYSLAMITLLRLPDLGVKPGAVNRATLELNRTLMALVEGQFLDLTFEKRLDVRLEEYLTMIDGKTAQLIASAAWLGAYVGCENDAVANCFRQFGRGIGLAFQIQDDILGIWGDPASTGKPAGDDILRRKKTLPLLYALQRAPAAEQDWLRKIYAGSEVTPEQVGEVTELLEQIGAREFAEEQAKKLLDEALLQLDQASPIGEAGQDLRQLAASLLKRRY